MNPILTLFHHNRKLNNMVLLFGLYCFGLLLLRAKMTQSLYLFFLVWNLILAFLPYLLSTYINVHFLRLKKQTIVLILSIWLAFLPNAFYIITDLVHLVRSTTHWFYFDLLLISSFALLGFFLGLISLFQFEKTLYQLRFRTKTIPTIVLVVCLLNGFGIYIGRELRFNSWEILSNPTTLFSTLLDELTTTKMLLFSLHFGLFIYMAFYLYKNVSLTSFSYDQRTI